MGCGHDRHGAARRRAAGRRHVLRVRRLLPPGRPARRAQRGQGHLQLHPRLRRRRRGRADPPARRAAGVDPGHPRPPGDPTGRRQRDRGGLAGRGRRRGARRPDPHPPGRPGGHHARAGPRASSTAPTSSTRPPTPTATSTPSTSCSSAPAARSPVPRRRRAARGRGAHASAWSPCRAGTCSSCSTPTPRRRCCPPACPPSPSRPASSFGWGAHADDVVGIDRFGASAPGAVVLEKLGINRRQRRRSGPRAARRHPRPRTRRGGLTMGRLHDLHELQRPVALARQPPARLDHLRRAGALGRAAASGGSRRTRRSSRRPSPTPPTTTSSSAIWSPPVSRSRTATGRSSPPTSRAPSRILRPVHDASDGVDGKVSVEVAPALAHDTAGTEAAARHLWTTSTSRTSS